MKRFHLVLFGLALLLTVLLSLNCAGPLRVDPLRVHAAPPVVDDDLELARAYAPILFKGVHPTAGRQDLPTRVDFDGDLRGDNNWENFPLYELPPTVYYAVLRTATHVFLTYHVFHPRDWEPLRLGLHRTHENDGENLQVVVDASSGDVVLLFTQAHYVGGVYAHAGEVPAHKRFGDGTMAIRDDLALLGADGKPAADGRHAAVYVESRGHGIYGVTDECAHTEVRADGSVRLTTSGLVFRPARPGEAVHEPSLPPAQANREAPTVAYQLESTTARLWPALADGSLLGKGGLLDGALDFESPVIRLSVPRYYEADRFSGPFGPDRGIAPFAVDFEFGEGEVGALFFDPARRYAECLRVSEPWALEYENYPFQR